MLRILLTIFLGVSIFISNSESAFAEGVNVLQNASLESGSVMPTSWLKGGWGNNTRTLSYPVTGIEGARAVSVTVSNYQTGDAKWYPVDVPVTSGKQYVVRDYYQSTAVSYITIRYLRTNGSYIYASLGTLPATATWKQFNGTSTAPSDAVSATVFHVIASNGTLLTDAYELREVDTIVTPPPPSPPPQATSTNSINLIANATLEVEASATGRPEKWQKGGWGTNNRSFSYPVVGIGGSKAAKVSISSFTNGDAKWYFDPVAVTPGMTYLFEDAYQSSASTEVVVRFGLTNGTYSYVYLGKLPSSNSTWNTFSKQVIAPSLASDLTVFHVLGGVGSLTIDNAMLRVATSSSIAKPLISLTFDDAYVSQYQKALPILESAGIDATFYITTGRVGTQPDRFMTWTQIQDLASKGHEIGGHTRNHLSLPSLSHDEQYAQIRGSYDDLVAQGFTPKTFAYPFGDENTTVHAVVQEAGFIGARGVVKGYSDSNSNRYALNDQHIESDVTLDMVKSYIDTAIQNNKWLILELHHQEDVSTNQYSNTPQLLQGIVDYIREKQIEAVTLKDGLFRIFGN